jgi:anti-sigma factor RsiW
MNCKDVLDLAPLYLTGELESTRAEQVAAHAKVCPSCARELGQQKTFDALLRQSVLAEHFDGSRVEGEVRRLIAQSSQRSGSQRWMFALAGIAALLLLALGIRTIFSSQAEPVYAAAALDHRLEIVNRQPRKWFTDRASIETLAGRQGISGSTIDAMAPAGYHLAQGKLCRLDGKIFLHLVYVSDVYVNDVHVNDAQNFSVFLGPADGAAAIHAETQGAEHVAGFRDRQLSVLIVTEQSGDAALRLARSTAAII